MLRFFSAPSSFQVNGREGKLPLERDSDVKLGYLFYVNLSESFLLKIPHF